MYKYHIILTLFLAAIPIACLVVYLQLNAYGWEICLSCIMASIPLYRALDHIKNQNKRVVDKIGEDNKFHHKSMEVWEKTNLEI